MTTRRLVTTDFKKGPMAGTILKAEYEFPQSLGEATSLFSEETVFEVFLEALEAELKIAMRRQPDRPQAAVNEWVPSSNRRALREAEKREARLAKSRARALRLSGRMTDEDREVLLKTIQARKASPDPSLDAEPDDYND